MWVYYNKNVVFYLHIFWILNIKLNYLFFLYKRLENKSFMQKKMWIDNSDHTVFDNKIMSKY